MDRIPAVDDNFDLPKPTRARLARNHGLYVVDRALGDGAADATAGIQSLLNAAGSGGGTVVIPDGTYLVAAALAIPSGVTVRGVGHRTLVKNAPAANSHVFSAQGATGFAIRDLAVDGNRAQQTAALSGIYVSNSTNGILSGLDVQGGKRIAAYPDPASGRGEGIEVLNASSHITISDCYTHDTDYDGIKIRGAHKVVISNHRAHNCGKSGIQFASDTAGPATYCTATNVLVTHDTGNPGSHSPETNAITWHDTEWCQVIGLSAIGTRLGFGNAGTNVMAAVIGANLRYRNNIGNPPTHLTGVLHQIFDGSQSQEVIQMARHVNGAFRKLVIDSRGLVWESGATPTVLAGL